MRGSQRRTARQRTGALAAALAGLAVAGPSPAQPAAAPPSPPPAESDAAAPAQGASASDTGGVGRTDFGDVLRLLGRIRRSGEARPAGERAAPQPDGSPAASVSPLEPRPAHWWKSRPGLLWLGFGLLAATAAVWLLVRRILASMKIPDLRAYAASDLGDISPPTFLDELEPPPLGLHVRHGKHDGEVRFVPS